MATGHEAILPHSCEVDENEAERVCVGQPAPIAGGQDKCAVCTHLICLDIWRKICRDHIRTFLTPNALHLGPARHGSISYCLLDRSKAYDPSRPAAIVSTQSISG